MEFESARVAAERLGVNIRTIQKWAKENKLEGAKRLGREWLIPKTAVPGENLSELSEGSHQLMPLLANDFVPGHCEEFILNLKDPDDRSIAFAEYNYYKGNTEKAIELSELYLDHKDYKLSLSASFIYAFANLSSGRLHLAKLGLLNIENQIKRALKQEDKQMIASAVFMGNATSVLLHYHIDYLPEVESVMRDLPQGLRIFAAYLMAHKAYLEKDYSRGAGIAEGTLATKGGYYPVPSLYLKLMRCVCLMNLKNSQGAKKAFADINPLAIDEEFYGPFAEHHGLLQGIIEAEIKKSRPEAYKSIVALVQRFSKGWRTVHNELTSNKVTVHLTTTEFAVAMLFNRSWSVKEISEHMNISPRMVKHHLSVIYEKLDVSNREELGKYLHK